MIEKIKNWFEFYPPFSATLEGWEEFNNRFKSEAPIRYTLNKIKNFIEYRPIRIIKDTIWWFKYRTTHRYHIVNTQLKPGYYDVDNIMLHSLFILLQKYVEIECANMYRLFYPWRARVFDNKRRGQEYLKCYASANSGQDGNVKYSQACRVALQVYEYWIIKRPQIVKNIEHLYEAFDRKNPESYKVIFAEENLLGRLDKVNLYKIIKFRKYFWT